MKKQQATNIDGFGGFNNNNNNNKVIEFRLLGSTITVVKSPEEDDPAESSETISEYSKSSHLPESESESADQTDKNILRFCERVRGETTDEEYLELLKYLYYFGIGKITRVDIKMTVNKMFPKFIDDFLDVMEFYESLNQSSSSESNQETVMRNKVNGKKLKRSIRQVDDGLTPSYKFLPKKKVSSAYHHQNRHCEADDPGPQVLNFSCYSKGSYDERDGKMPKVDSHQEKLNDREDELYEKDMLAEWIHSAKHNSNKLHEAISKGENKNPDVEIVNKHLTASNFRLIESMYGEQGLRVVNYLRQSPQVMLPFIVRRLTQKENDIPGLVVRVCRYCDTGIDDPNPMDDLCFFDYH